MAKAIAATAKTAPAAKKPATTKTRARATPASETAQPSAVEPGTDVVGQFIQRLEAVEEKITTGLLALGSEVQALKGSPPPVAADGEAPPDTSLPLIADIVRRSLMEHLTPVTAALKRLEERVGFIGNRLKHTGGGGGLDRQKPWRHDQPRHPRPPRGQHNAPRPSQGQQPPWTPPSASSVQGHFAPRPLPRGEMSEDDE